MIALSHYFISALVTIIYLICVSNLGILVFRLTGIEKILTTKNDLLYITLSALLGLSLISNYWLIIGLHSFLSLWVIVCSLVLLALFSYKFKDVYLQALKYVRSLIKKLHEQDFLIRTSLYLTLFLLLLLGINSLIVMPWGDSEAFYMVWPKLISHMETVIPQPIFYTFSGIGVSGELHSAVLMTLFSGNSASFLVWFVALFIIIVLNGICTECDLKTDSKIICLLLITSSSAFLAIIPFGNVNLFAAGFSIAAIYFIILTLKGLRDKKIQMITGLLLGFAMIAKVSYAVVLFPTVLLLLLFYIFKSSDKFKLGLKNGTFYGLILLVMVIIAFLPHLYKNFLLFNEPFAPIYFFHSDGEMAIQNQVWFENDVTKWIVLTYPIVLIFGKFPMQGGNISPLIFILLPILFFSYKRILKLQFQENYSLILAIVSLFSIAVWVALKPSIVAPRYILISMIMLFPFFGSLYQFIEYNPIKKIIKLSLVFVILLTFLHHPVPMFGKMIYNELKGNSQQNHRFYNVSKYLNELVTSNDRIYLAGYYSYQLRSDIISNLQSPNDYEKIGLLYDENAYSNYFNELHKIGFTLLYVQKETHLHLIPHSLIEDKKNIIYQDEHSVIVKIK